MSDLSDLGGLYRDTRERLTALVTGLDAGGLAAGVPACPGWAVRDVIAHLVAIPQDAAAGRMTGIPTEEFTAAQVARLADVPVPEMLARWSAGAAQFEQGIAAFRSWPAVVDVATHEQDIRGALGQPGARDCAAIRQSMHRLMHSIAVPVPLEIITEDGSYAVGGPDDGPGGDVPPLTLTTSRYEAFRWRMGRRSPAQLAAMAWSADPPATVLGALTIFGPAATDIRE